MTAVPDHITPTRIWVVALSLTTSASNLHWYKPEIGIVAVMVLVLALGIFTPMWDMMRAVRGQ